MTTTNYINAIERELQTGHATEHSYRPMLRQFLAEWSQNFSPTTDYSITNEPQRIAGNAPDFLVQRGEVSLGWIETKPPGTNLDTEEESEQLQRYRKAFPNFILTDYLEFRLYSEGENCLSARIADLNDTANRLMNQNTDDSEISILLRAFFEAEPIRVGKASDLSRMLSGKAQLLKIEIADLLQNTSNDELQNRLEAFREHLIADLSEADFADMMAQTITYSLFAARCHHTHGTFTRARAIEILEEMNPFLSQLLWISIQRLTQLHWIIDPIAELLDLADMESITADFGKEGRQAGPIIHFYEDFLSDYDPEIRKRRGVYYTPEEVVSYIVRSVDILLTESFNLSNGLAHTGTVDVNGTQLPKVQILDPAAGTGTFLRSVISQIYHTITTSGMAGAWQEYVPQHLLSRLHGFERMVAPYAMCHLALTYQLKELGYHLKADERLNVFLTDTLEAGNRQRGMPIFIDEIAKEAEAAATVKSDLPVMVIVKNPPYAGKSENKGKWITNLLRGLDGDILTESYFEVDGKPLDETTQRWLSDDYVKFIRFAQWRIAQTGYGVLAFISNHGYLKNHTFSGMRQSLMETFDAIYILDLHGNKTTNEEPPNGGPDENVFEIKQGVAIGIFVKHAPEKLNPTTRVCHAELWGDRSDKYSWLATNTINTTPWKALTPTSPNYRFAPKGKSEEYEHYRKITDIFPLNKTGLSTKRDKMVIDFESKPILERVNHFRNSTEPDEILCEQLPISMIAEWNISKARESLRNEQHIEKYIQPILHFPFDERFIFYHDDLVARPRKDVMRHLLAGENIAMCVGRAGEAVGNATWNLVSISKTITDLNVFRRGGTPVFPLYRYAEQGSHRFHNISQSFVEEVCQHLNYEIDSTDAMSFIPDGKGDLHTTIGPEDIFHYIYAILHAQTYRQRYAEQLKDDFPHIPLTTNLALFYKLVSLGEQLAEAHLLQSEDASFLPEFPEGGNPEVKKIRWSEVDQRVWINPTQYFAPVRRKVWEFRVGGHCPAKKWLTDRKSRTLTFDEIEHYRRICGALDKTVKIMEDIDNTITEHGGWPLENNA